MNTMSRRDALKLGTNAAVSAAITPLLSAESSEASSVEAGLSSTKLPTSAKTSDSSNDICFMRAVDMAKLIREKKVSAPRGEGGAFCRLGGCESHGKRG